MTTDLYSLALSVPWCCTAEALEAILSIAGREPLPTEEIARRMHGPRSLALRKGQRREDSGRMTMQGPVAVIPIDGPIYRYADIFTAVSGGVTTESLVRDLGLALDDPAVSALMLLIDSPGGEAAGISELSDLIYNARGRKPIIAYAEGYCASAAYWIGSAADMLIADSTALIGSIGTVMGVPDPTKRMSYRIDFVSRQSPKKRPDVTTDEGRAVVQQLVDDLTDVFIASVARNRGLDPAQILAVEGGMLVGQQAVDAGLADGLGAEEQLIQGLRRGMSPAIADRRSSIQRAPLMSAQEGVMAETKQGFWAWVTGTPETAAPLPDRIARQEAIAEPPAPQQRTDDAEKAELRRQLAQLQAAQIQKDAQAFADKQLSSGHAFPAEAQPIAALYARAAELDAASPRTDGSPSNVALLEAAYAARPASSLSKQLLEPGIKGTVLAAAPSSEQEELDATYAAAAAYGKARNGRGRN